MKSNKIYDIYILSKNLISNTNVSINSIHMLLEILRKRFSWTSFCARIKKSIV